MYKIFYRKLKQTFEENDFYKNLQTVKSFVNTIQIITHNVTDMTHYIVLFKKLEQLTRHIPTMMLFIIELFYGVTQLLIVSYSCDIHV